MYGIFKKMNAGFLEFSENFDTRIFFFKNEPEIFGNLGMRIFKNKSGIFGNLGMRIFKNKSGIFRSFGNFEENYSKKKYNKRN